VEIFIHALSLSSRLKKGKPLKGHRQGDIIEADAHFFSA
jgi:hypothetical protein